MHNDDDPRDIALDNHASHCKDNPLRLALEDDLAEALRLDPDYITKGVERLCRGPR